jgi:thiol-disulfide isomerase/thioredoxin
MKKFIVALLILVSVGVATFVAVRYVRRRGGEQSAFPPAAPSVAGGRAKLTFIKDARTVPPLVMKTIDGKTLDSKDFKGKVVLVNFWATWCQPCRDEIPDLIELQERYKDQLIVVGISSDEGPVDMVSRFVAEHKMNYPIVMETEELGKVFPGIYALPTTFTLDSNMRMVQKHIGRLNPAIVELETRYLAKLPVEADVEEVAASADGDLTNQAQATDVPGLKLDTLTTDQKVAALKQLNEQKCDCGCGLTLAQCRINDPSCTVSLPIAEKIVAEVRKK